MEPTLDFAKHSRCFVFKEVDVDGETYFQHFKKSDDTYALELAQILNSSEHWQLLTQD